MPFDHERYQWVCPECEDTFGTNGKGQERYISHLESHLDRRRRVFVVQHHRTRMLVGVFEEREAFEEWLGNKHNDWDEDDLHTYSARVRT